jgi:hypothetical protein
MEYVHVHNDRTVPMFQWSNHLYSVGLIMWNWKDEKVRSIGHCLFECIPSQWWVSAQNIFTDCCYSILPGNPNLHYPDFLSTFKFQFAIPRFYSFINKCYFTNGDFELKTPINDILWKYQLYGESWHYSPFTTEIFVIWNTVELQKSIIDLAVLSLTPKLETASKPWHKKRWQHQPITD